MNKYILTIKRKTEATVFLEYDAAMKSVTIETPGLDPAQIQWLLNNVPVLEDALGQLTQAYPFITVKAVPKDLSFNAFWETYGYKVGNKARAMKLYAATSDADRTAIFAKIPLYKMWLTQRPSTEMLYPETFLHQKRWQSDYKIS